LFKILLIKKFGGERAKRNLQVVREGRKKKTKKQIENNEYSA